MLSLRLLLEGANGLFMLRLLHDELPSLLLCLDIFYRERERDLDAEIPLDWLRPVSWNVLVRLFDLDVPDMLNESPVLYVNLDAGTGISSASIVLCFIVDARLWSSWLATKFEYYAFCL